MIISIYPDRHKSIPGHSTFSLQGQIITHPGKAGGSSSNSEETKLCYTRRQNTEEYFWQGEGPLSIKCWFTGLGMYEADGGRFAVTPNAYLILNRGQRYCIHREPEAEEESLLVFFAASYVEDVCRNQMHPS